MRPRPSVFGSAEEKGDQPAGDLAETWITLVNAPREALRTNLYLLAFL